MRKTTSLLAASTLSASLLLTGCGTSGTTATPASSNTASASAAGASSCPTDNTQAFAKTRFVTNVGLASGAFYQWIFKPYQAGTFQKGADGRTFALVKAGLAGAFAAKQVKDATDNVKADPTLCKVFITPMTKLQEQLNSLGDKVRSGDLAAVTGVATQVEQLKSLAGQEGMKVIDQEVKL
jgi:hypothetical protein